MLHPPLGFGTWFLVLQITQPWCDGGHDAPTTGKVFLPRGRFRRHSVPVFDIRTALLSQLDGLGSSNDGHWEIDMQSKRPFGGSSWRPLRSRTALQKLADRRLKRAFANALALRA